MAGFYVRRLVAMNGDNRERPDSLWVHGQAD